MTCWPPRAPLGPCAGCVLENKNPVLARQPNISVPLFLVAPEERRDQVIRQVNRPTLERMKPPLAQAGRETWS